VYRRFIENIENFIYRAAFGFINMLAHGETTDEFNYILYKTRGYSPSLTPQASIHKNRNYLYRSLGLDREGHQSIALKMALNSLLVFPVALLFGFFTNIFSSYYNSSAFLSTESFVILTTETFLLIFYFCILHTLLESYYRKSRPRTCIPHLFFLTVTLIFIMPKIEAFCCDNFDFLYFLLVIILSFILCLPIMALHLIVEAATERAMFRGLQ